MREIRMKWYYSRQEGKNDPVLIAGALAWNSHIAERGNSERGGTPNAALENVL